MFDTIHYSNPIEEIESMSRSGYTYHEQGVQNMIMNSYGE